MKAVYRWSLGLAALLVFGMVTTVNADWPQFRGANSNAVDSSADLPIEFDGATGKNIAWKVSIPGRSVGGAIVVGDQVVTTTSVGMDERRVRLLSYNAATGGQNWVQEFVARGRPYCHQRECSPHSHLGWEASLCVLQFQ
jgi:hypothetical protein